jgi:hypothetical protein
MVLERAHDEDEQFRSDYLVGTVMQSLQMFMTSSHRSKSVQIFESEGISQRSTTNGSTESNELTFS